MAKINISNIPLNAYLRADSHSQLFILRNEDGDGRSFVSPEMFWGNVDDINDENKEAIYLHYSNIKNRNIYVSTGIEENGMSRVYWNNNCDEWISGAISNIIESKLYVIRGYAGCGKSTFINYLLQKNKKEKYTYIDIGEKWSYKSEPYMFFNQALNEVDNLVENINKDMKNREKIWDKFFELGRFRTLENFHSELPNIISRFIDIKSTSNWNTLGNNVRQFLFSVYSERKENGQIINNFRRETNNWHSVGHTDAIVALLMLLICAKSIVEQTCSDGYTLIFDNLDVITNPAIPSESVVFLWGVVDGYNTYQKEYSSVYNHDLINFNIIIAVRKVLYSHIVSHLPDLEMIVNYDSYYVNVCDISNLYLSQDILEHRIKYWISHITDTNTIQKLTHLGEIKAITSRDEEKTDIDNKEYEVQNSINLDAFFNHNYRAFSNLLASFFDEDKYSVNIMPDFKKNSESSQWQKVATLIFAVSLFYRDEEVWNELGFGCNNFTTIDYPTTFNRLILNYLYVHRYGQEIRHYAPERADIPFEGEVTLTTLIEIFEKAIFFSAPVSYNEEQLKLEYDKRGNTKNKDNTELLLERLANMCARNRRVKNEKAYGYDSNSDELWRRPIYFTGGVKLYHTAASDLDLKKYFEQCFADKDTDRVKFSITDEGAVLIHDIVANFEFYSARYCDDADAKPLHHVKTVEEIDILISSVYNAVKLCCDRHKVFMENYMKEYGLNKNDYLKSFMHPRTNPRLRKKNGIINVVRNSFRPQLHIVRVIFSHINYFLAVEKLIESSTYKDKNIMCTRIYNWINLYLKLYKNNFYGALEDTICYFDNNVYRNLCNRFETAVKEKNIEIEEEG